jgi:hypothetical protein
MALQGAVMNEILRVTAEGEFIWHEDADRMIEEYNHDDAPAMKHILKRLRNSVMDVSAAKRIATGLGWEPKREWVGLTDEEMLAAIRPMYRSDGIAQNALDLSKDEYRAIEAALKDKNQ